MTFISYSQNHEDVMLWRALKHVKNGFYIDVGANHPSDDSVTKAFYDRGWSGINIEPLPQHIAQLQAERPRDINLQVAMGAEDGEIELYDTLIRGLATASLAVAELHHAAGLTLTSSLVPMRRLDGIFAEYAKGDVHFLKIDVEGFERSVLEGMDFSRFRPWIVMVEATIPNSQKIDANWEPILLDAGYRCVFFDGLNRYYTSPERENLVGAFAAPPNVFDEYISAETQRLGQCLEANSACAAAQIDTAQAQARDAENQAREAQHQAREAENQACEAQHQAREAQHQAREEQHQAREAQHQAREAQEQSHAVQSMLTAVYNSTSWRLTMPLRQLGTSLQQLRQHRVAAMTSLRAMGVSAILGMGQKVAVVLDAHPKIRRMGGNLLRALGLHSRAVALHSALRSGRHPAFDQHALLPGVDAGAYTLARFSATVFPNRPLPPEAMFLERDQSAGTQEFWFRFTGHVEGHYSLAIVNRGLAVALDAVSQAQVAFRPCHGELYDNPVDLPLTQRAQLEAMFGRRIPVTAADHTISIAHHFPLISDAEKSRYRLTIFFWEETAVPVETVSHINENFDAVLVATHFVKRVLRNSGCRLPVFVIPIGIDHLVSPDVAPLEEIKPAPDTAFRFLHVSSVFERKGVDVLLKAFFDQFSAGDAVELYIKTFPNPHNHVREQLDALRRGRTNAPKVIIDEEPLGDAGMLALYRSAQALVLPTRGEGFNLPAAEGLALGLPVIVTGYGAHLDFCTRATTLLVPFHFSRSMSHLKSAEACWVEPDALALGDQMRQLRSEVMSDDDGLARRRQAGIEHVRQTYTWQQSARAVLESVHWLDANLRTDRSAASQRLALLSPWKTRCGIAEYSHKLLSACSPSHSLQVFCDTRTSPEPAQSIYRPSWKIGSSASVCAAIDEIGQEKFDVLLVQHQPSLFTLTEEVCQRLVAIRDQGCVVILELHATLPLLNECRLSSKSVAALRTLDRIVVHQPEDLNHLLALGLANNVLLLAHGVVQPQEKTLPGATRSAWGIGDDELVLACFGFILPHKGIETLVESIKPLARASKRSVRLLGLNSTLDSRSEDTLRACEKRARALGVDSQITWITDFRPIDECVQLLGMADYIVFPYKETRESASGAVTIGLAALKPVLVSPLPIFSDLSDCTWRMAGAGVQDIVDAVCVLEKDPEHVRQLVATQQQWLAERNWSRVSASLEAVIQGLLLDRQLEASISNRRERFIAANEEVRSAQLLVDVSEMYFRDAKTGIQRVVRSILGELLAAPPQGFQIRPIYGTPNRGYRYTDKFTSSRTQDGYGFDEQPVHVRAGDVFLGLDLSAHLFPQAEAELRKFRLAGAKVYFVVYDIIPLLHPQFTVAGISDAFEVWLQSLAREADGLLCISAAVAEEVRAWLNQHAEARVLPEVRHFHLGADIENSSPSTGLPADAAAVLEKISRQPSFLMVGTVEPRKAQAQALAAFEQLWREGVPAHLVLIGKEGWMMEDFSRKVRAHPEFGQRLFWLEGISDEFLEQVYGAASCLIAASEAEGFGLPLIEAVQHRLPIIARDIPVFREVAGRHAYYFSGQQPETLAEAIRNWLALHQAGRAPQSSSMPWLTWQQSTKSLLDIVLTE
ncbi:FkbM family methyltransferase [Rhodoferax antarcticus]|uniref:FkbM family methyltransferase n=1 Tax=Rhodoferax antarcticus TaxID=81479 RepID=UPI0022246CFE|nr:FkbM family methyltransferase [Rhodoferax antarcticus]MCW2313984.1 FkbM family methyltransferase [Rhodoferax antarcticus]